MKGVMCECVCVCVCVGVCVCVCEEGERAGRVSVSEGSLCVFVKDTER